MNQVTTKVLGNNQGSKLVPALGMQCITCLLLCHAHIVSDICALVQQGTAGHMQQPVGWCCFGKNRHEAHSCTSLHICQPKQLSISLLQMASEAAEARKGLEQEANDMLFLLVLYTCAVFDG